MNPIVPLQPSAALGSSTSGTGGQQYHPPQMQSGQTMPALVVEAVGDNRFILDIGSNRILAQGDSVTLSPGQSLQLQVTATTPRLEFQIIAPSLQQFLGHSLSFVGHNLDLNPLIQIMHQPPNPAIETFTPASRQVLEAFWALQQKPLSSGPEGAAVLRQMVDSMGLQLEAQLGRGQEVTGSLKSALLELVQQFKEAEQIREPGKALLAIIESFQLCQLRLDQDKSFIIPLPFPFLDQGYLLIDQKQDQETEDHERKKQLHFSLHLSLTGLGDLNIELLQTDDGLWMRFNCDSQDKADFVSQFGDDLKQQLADLPVQSLAFSGTANDPGTDLIRLLVPAGQSLLNTKV